MDPVENLTIIRDKNIFIKKSKCQNTYYEAVTVKTITLESGTLNPDCV